MCSILATYQNTRLALQGNITCMAPCIIYLEVILKFNQKSNGYPERIVHFHFKIASMKKWMHYLLNQWAVTLHHNWAITLLNEGSLYSSE